MKFRRDWWKVLAVILMVYVIIAGIKIPLNPGVLSNSNSQAYQGKPFATSVDCYNSFLRQAEDLNVYLWLPSDQLIKADSIVVLNDTRMEAYFHAIPTDFTIDSKNGLMVSLLLDNELEGHYFYRNAVNIKASEGSEIQLGEYASLDVIRTKKRFALPFQHILYETSRNTFFHVAIWMAMFALLICSCWNSVMYLIKKEISFDAKSSSLTNVALVFGIAGLLTGSMWAKYTWGAFWTDDIKLNMTAVSLLIYLAYWVLRASVSDPDARARLSSVFNLFAFVCLMVLVMVIPRLTDSLHPGNGGNPAFSSYDMDNVMRMVFYPAIIAYFLIGYWMAELNFRYLILKEKLQV